MRLTTPVALFLLTAAIVLPGPVLAGGARQDKPADVAGTWAITVEIGGNTGNPTLTLKQDGETLTGTYASQVFGEQKVTGTIKGNAITFEFTGTIEGNSMKVTYSGTVDQATMKGKVSLGELGEGTFTAKKQ
jgi:hypothetical protein